MHKRISSTLLLFWHRHHYQSASSIRIMTIIIDRPVKRAIIDHHSGVINHHRLRHRQPPALACCRHPGRAVPEGHRFLPPGCPRDAAAAEEHWGADELCRPLPQSAPAAAARREVVRCAGDSWLWRGLDEATLRRDKSETGLRQRRGSGEALQLMRLLTAAPRRRYDAARR